MGSHRLRVQEDLPPSHAKTMASQFQECWENLLLRDTPNHEGIRSHPRQQKLSSLTMTTKAPTTPATVTTTATTDQTTGTALLSQTTAPTPTQDKATTKDSALQPVVMIAVTILVTRALTPLENATKPSNSYKATATAIATTPPTTTTTVAVASPSTTEASQTLLSQTTVFLLLLSNSNQPTNTSSGDNFLIEPAPNIDSVLDAYLMDVEDMQLEHNGMTSRIPLQTSSLWTQLQTLSLSPLQQRARSMTSLATSFSRHSLTQEVLTS